MLKSLCKVLSYSSESVSFLVSTQTEEEKGGYVKPYKDWLLSAGEKHFLSQQVCVGTRDWSLLKPFQGPQSLHDQCLHVSSEM